MEAPTSSTPVRGAAPSPDDAASLTAILRIGRYDILGRLAVGGMSELFLAHERVAGETLRRVVIKVLATPEKSALADSAWVALFEREGRTTARLDHPNICHVYEFGHVGAQCFIAMEWVQGVSLRELLMHLRDSQAGLPMPLAVNIAAQVAAALEHARTATNAHDERLSVVHRDINPANVMIRHDGVVKLVDFGVAQVEEQRGCPANQRIQGKLAYMAPEQIRGESLDHRADIFALGICLFELVSGTRLYRRASPSAVRDAVLDPHVPSLRALTAAIPEELDAIVQRALQKDPDARYQTAGELQTALEEFLARRGEVASARPLAAFMGEQLGDRRSMPPLARDEAVRARLIALLPPEGAPAPLPQTLASLPPAQALPPSPESSAPNGPGRTATTGPSPLAQDADALPMKRVDRPIAFGVFAAAALWAGVYFSRTEPATYAAPPPPDLRAPTPAASPPKTPAVAPEAPPRAATAEAESPLDVEPPPKRPRAKRPRPTATFVRDPGF
jgi:serine/threonine protein kinase